MLRILTLALGLVLAGPACLAAGPAFSSLPMPQAAPLLTQPQGAIILDVREPDEFAQGHVPGALNVPLQQVGSWAKDQAKETPLLVICRSGRRSLKASAELAGQGFTHVTNVEGGFLAWCDQRLPVETPPATP